MEREALCSEVRSRIEPIVHAADIDRLTDEITTCVMMAAEPGEVRSIHKIEASLNGDYACDFDRRTMETYPQFPRAAFYNTDSVRLVIPADVLAALQKLAA